MIRPVDEIRVHLCRGVVDFRNYVLPTIMRSASVKEVPPKTKRANLLRITGRWISWGEASPVSLSAV